MKRFQRVGVTALLDGSAGSGGLFEVTPRLTILSLGFAVVLGAVAIPDDDHLLVVGAEREHPLVQQHLAARPVDGAGERPVRDQLRAHHTGVRVPQQSNRRRSRPLSGSDANRTRRRTNARRRR